MKLTRNLILLCVAVAFVATGVNAEDKKESDQLEKVVQEVKSEPVAEKPAVEKSPAEKPAVLAVKDSSSNSNSDEENKQLEAIIKEADGSKNDKPKDKNSAQEVTSDESDEDSDESDSKEDASDESSSDSDEDSEEQSESQESKSKSKESDESDSEDSDSDSDESDEDESTSKSKEDNKDSNVVISNVNSINGHAQKDQLLASEDNQAEHTNLNTDQQPKKFNQTFLIIAIGVLTVVCFTLAVALIIKRRVMNANRNSSRSPRNPIYQEVTQTETA